MAELPKKITPTPIKEVTTEIRFQSAFPPDAIFGVVYSGLRDSYTQPEPLPILQIPEIVRNSDPSLAFQAFYRLKRDSFILQVGPKVLSISLLGEYSDWNAYLDELIFVFKKAQELDFISKVQRVGIRYINVFDEDIFENINLKFSINENEIKSRDTSIRTLFEIDGFQVNLQVANQVKVKILDNEESIKSLIDLDVTLESDAIDFNNIDEILEEAHRIEKEKFYSLLKPEFLESLNPTY